ncbi:MAG: 16S rRNA (cytidine(1402)-2'-O)-methyltransferase [Bacilli bacterium]|nr:16S rRNA (cytidine(1402)-2'-O)-methyltransferase [Bacilli bacterium]MDD7314418.1 16S rRNA (cytidine(1402)-2'-O)-methyltransferase [Bacilli bacterium]
MLKRQKTYEDNMSAKLYLVGTPIGNFQDMTYRAVDTLKYVDEIYCEDTRITGLLLKHFEIPTKMHSYHIYNEKELSSSIIEKIKSGKNIAVVSDAGMPSISDPGYLIATIAIQNDIDVCIIPGVSAGITALVGSGIPSNKFTFVGFLNSKDNKRKEELEQLKFKEETLILYEAPHRIKETLEMLNDIMPNREIVLARELTKKYEEYLRGTSKEILEVVEELKGEMVIIISGCQNEEKVAKLISLSIKEHYRFYIENGYENKEAMKLVAKDRGISKSEVYQEIMKK